MAGYYGTETQQRLQTQAEASAGFVTATPGACQAGRIVGCDDPDKLGWDHIAEIIERDGVCGFRLIDTERVDEIRARLSHFGCRLDTWDVFLADRAAALAASARATERELPDTLSCRMLFLGAESGQVRELQSLMVNGGLVPFSGSMLTGEFGSVANIALVDINDRPIACAHGCMPHNSFSRYHTYAWGGLVAVEENYRGKGLGKYVNALMIEQIFEELDADHIYELVSATNLPSRLMVEACGLRLQPPSPAGSPPSIPVSVLPSRQSKRVARRQSSF